MAASDNKPSQSQLSEEFMAVFNKRKDDLTRQIEQLNSEESRSEVNEKLTNMSSEIQKLSKTLHDAVMFLPSYSIKMRQNEIRDLEKTLKDKEDELVPKKRFGFRAKVVPPPPSNVSKDIQPQSEINSNLNTNTEASNIDNYFTIEKVNGQTVRYSEGDLNGNDVLVKDAEDAIIILEGSPSTLRLANLKNCKLLCGPVRTSVFVDNVINSVLFLCCQQLRTHSSEKVDIYLRVRSRAIIEDCKNIRFGPYKWIHQKSDELHVKAEISPTLERYDAVDDFNWLSSTPSPNWCLVPETEWISFDFS